MTALKAKLAPTNPVTITSTAGSSVVHEGARTELE